MLGRCSRKVNLPSGNTFHKSSISFEGISGWGDVPATLHGHESPLPVTKTTAALLGVKSLVNAVDALGTF